MTGVHTRVTEVPAATLIMPEEMAMKMSGTATGILSSLPSVDRAEISPDFRRRLGSARMNQLRTSCKQSVSWVLRSSLAYDLLSDQRQSYGRANPTRRSAAQQ